MLKAWKMTLLRLQGILLQRSNVEKINLEEIFETISSPFSQGRPFVSHETLQIAKHTALIHVS